MKNIKCDERGDLVSQCYDGIGSSVDFNDTGLSSDIEDMFFGNTSHRVYMTLDASETPIQFNIISSTDYLLFSWYLSNSFHHLFQFEF